MPAEILPAFALDKEQCTITPFGSGLINHTWLVSCSLNQYVLQRINNSVFKTPENIDANIVAIGAYLQTHAPHYPFVQPLKTVDGKTLLQQAGGWFRLSPFVAGSHTIDVVSTPSEAFEAASQFGGFTAALKNFDTNTLQTTLPDFHNLSLRWHQFEQSVKNATAERAAQARPLIQFLKGQQSIVQQYEQIVGNRAFKKRVTHHDTKISNVLFNASGKGLCVIDLDTVMPGYFISDVGDMLRTYLSPVSEEEADFEKIKIRENYFTAIAEGYLGQMQNELTDDEKAHFVYAGKFMIYMQALRFLTDYLNNDVYYGQKYEGHNLVRAGNQASLLEQLIQKEGQLQATVSAIVQLKHERA